VVVIFAEAGFGTVADVEVDDDDEVEVDVDDAAGTEMSAMALGFGTDVIFRSGTRSMGSECCYIYRRAIIVKDAPDMPVLYLTHRKQ
jgi:hypothetical protein